MASHNDTSPAVGADQPVETPAGTDPSTAPKASKGSKKPAGSQGSKKSKSSKKQKDTKKSKDAKEPKAAKEPKGGAGPTEPAPAGEAAFGLLFQAPDPTVRSRGRRATAAAGSPTRPDRAAPADETDTGSSAAQDSHDRQQSAASAGDDSRPAEADASSRDAPTDQSDQEGGSRRSRRRGGRGRRSRGDRPAGGDQDQQASVEGAEGEQAPGESAGDRDAVGAAGETGSRRRRRRRRSGSGGDGDDPPGTVTKVREPRKAKDEVTAVKGSTRLEAKKQRRREGREAGRRRTIITEAEFLARRESVDRVMAVREVQGRTQIGVLEDGVLVEHYVSREQNVSMVGNVYLGRVQNVLPSMEAAFVDIGKGRNAVLYAGEVNWDAAGLEGNMPKRIENALSSGDTVLVQVTKDPIGHKGARLTSQVSLPGRFLVYVPEASMTGISRKLPDTERTRLKRILKQIVPDSAGVIVRTAAEGASEEELRGDVERLTRTWDRITSAAEKTGKKKGNAGAPQLLHGEPDLTVKVIRDVFNEDFSALVVSGDSAWQQVSAYLTDVAPDLAERMSQWTGPEDLFRHHRVDEQLAKALDRKVWLPSGGSLVIDRTEAMTVVDVNTGKFVGSGGNLEETVTKNNIEAAEEIVRQLRLRDLGGIIVIDFIDMVLESNRDLVIRRLLECLGRDRTKHQVAEVTSLGLVQMTRKRVGSGLLEVFSETCDHCKGRGIIVHADPVEAPDSEPSGRSSVRRGRGGSGSGGSGSNGSSARAEAPAEASGPTAAQIAAAAHAAAVKRMAGESHDDTAASTDDAPAAPAAAPAVTGSDTTDADTDADVADSHVPEASTRPRRRRARAVAQAGPPGKATILTVPTTSPPTGSEPS